MKKIDKNSIIVDPEDLEILRSYHWSFDGNYFCRYTRNRKLGERKKFYLHRVLINCPIGKQVDHIDGDVCNNSKSNLRIVTAKENAVNRSVQSNNKLGFKGVTAYKHGFKVTKTKDGNQIHIGVYKTLDDAIKASISADKKFFGEFSRFNKKE